MYLFIGPLRKIFIEYQKSQPECWLAVVEDNIEVSQAGHKLQVRGRGSMLSYYPIQL